MPPAPERAAIPSVAGIRRDLLGAYVLISVGRRVCPVEPSARTESAEKFTRGQQLVPRITRSSADR